MPLGRLPVETHSGSVAFCNPNVALVKNQAGEKRLVVTLFVPAEGSAPGGSGELLYVIKP